MSKKVSSKIIAAIVLLAVVVTIDVIIKRPFFASAEERIYTLLHNKDRMHVKGDSEKLNSHDFLSKYYNFFGYTKYWTDSTRQNDKYRDMLIEMLHHADSLGLDRKDYHQDYITPKIKLEEELKKLEIGFKMVRSLRANEDITLYYTVSGSRAKLDQFAEFLLGFRAVKAFDE